MKYKPGLFYLFLKLYLPLIFRLYYRRFRIIGKENVPRSGPLIFAINHQNAFMDAIVVAASSVRNPWFLTRASVFDSPMARYLLSKLQMIPIYRFRDGMAAMKRNDETLETCSRLLNHDQCILIFPEGNHDGRWALRPLQKGLARIVFSTMDKTSGATNVQIVPVGLQYENIFAAYSDLLISFGKPIPSASYYELHKSDPAKAVTALMEEVRAKLSQLMVDIQPPEAYEAKREALLDRPGREQDLQARLLGDRKYLEEISENNDAAVSSKNRKNKIWCLPSAILLLPHLPSIWLIRMIVNAVVKDHHWTSSIRVAALAFGAPLVYAAELAILSSYFNWWTLALIAAVILPATGLLGLRLRDQCRGSAL